MGVSAAVTSSRLVSAGMLKGSTQWVTMQGGREGVGLQSEVKGQGAHCLSH